MGEDVGEMKVLQFEGGVVDTVPRFLLVVVEERYFGQIFIVIDEVSEDCESGGGFLKRDGGAGVGGCVGD